MSGLADLRRVTGQLEESERPDGWGKLSGSVKLLDNESRILGIKPDCLDVLEDET